MRLLAHRGSIVALLVFGGLAAGCSPEPVAPPGAAQAGSHDHAAHGHEHGHSHAHDAGHGDSLHGGKLIELGKEEYHAEVVDNQAAGSLLIYVLDGSAKKSMPIAAEEITINLKQAGKPAQFKLPAYPDSRDPEGKSSRFISSDKDLLAGLTEKGSEAQLVLEINGAQFSALLGDEPDHQ